MISNCLCHHCGNPIEFEAEESAAVGTCPHCGKQTTLGATGQGQPTRSATVPLKTVESKAGGQHFSFYAAVVTVLLVGSIGLNILLLNRKPAPSNEAELSRQISDLKQQLEGKKQALIAALQTNVAQDNKALNETVCGIYEFDDSTHGRLPQKLDIRSDGTVITSELYNESEMARKQKTWSMENEAVLINGNGTFKIEGDDLIDAKGNRWLRIR